MQINRGNVKGKPNPFDNLVALPQAAPGRTPIIAANWKMNMTVESAIALVDDMLDDLDVLEGVETVICPPYIALYPLQEMLDETIVMLGAQNLYWEEKGAFTGEISPLMLRELCDYVIIGHSERRTLFGETDDQVNLKVRTAIRHDLRPIIAVGENLAQRERGLTEDHIRHQIEKALEDVTAEDVATAVIAYEPIWAIGTGRAATPDDANNIAGLIRSTLRRMYDPATAQQVRIQYGGSVNPQNIADFMRQPDIDGALVGGASLIATDFVKIVAKTLEVTSKK